uniref:Uncharacterized protein n=1 Tax=Romanomermis culicivorax TaxID=13658 RepID=A0A915J8Y4_ROMCU
MRNFKINTRKRRHRALKAQNRFEPRMWHIFEQSLAYVMEQELKESSRPLSDNQRRVAVSGWLYFEHGICKNDEFAHFIQLFSIFYTLNFVAIARVDVSSFSI